MGGSESQAVGAGMRQGKSLGGDSYTGKGQS
jgi:hypothetical protein